MKPNKADKTVNFLMYLAGMAFNLTLMVVLVFLVINAFSWGYNTGENFANEMLEQGDDYSIEFYIPHDTPPSEIARQLEDMGIIHNRHMFRLELFLRGSSGDFIAGTYTVNLNMNNVELNRALRVRPEELAPHHVIQIREGMTIRDMAAYFEYRGFFSAEEFIHTAQYGRFSFGFLLDVPMDRPNRLEGYLFPDTYQIPMNPSPVDIITRMLHNFSGRFTDDHFERMEELNMSMDDVIIMASIIERETRLASERPIVSQVIHERLRVNMRLEMCSTVKYAMAEPPIRLNNADIDRYAHSLHNTYRHNGLPIGPIASPGLASINAALWPADSTYLFFVLRDEETGAHHFSHTLAEHNAATDRYLGSS
ncbi:MAG: endolytic transglycosylase MltG [Defluviitaleaceae bacterium]|nr:endolytic transglycosylase MltG [Defluviitaleaceae bacterium]